MVRKGAIPDAWEDDWEAQADKAVAIDEDEEGGVNISQPLNREERLLKHNESNRKLWESAESPQTFHYVEANNNIPLASDFKPQVKVLSRKPAIAKRGQGFEDGDDGTKKEVQLSPEEIRTKQKRDREEKQRRYEEARAKIFGESNPSSTASSPGTVTPPRGDGQFTPRGRGRGRGGFRNNNHNQNVASNSSTANERQQPQYDSFDARRPVIPSMAGRELYDPNGSPRPDYASKRGTANSSPASSTKGFTIREDQQQPLRAPRGPDGSGRGGFGFAQRGAKES